METTLKIEGMTCDHCTRAVRRALEAIPGAIVEEVRIGEARVRTDDDATREASSVRAVEAEGYRVMDVA
jgi:copper chaperone CopZ